MVEGSEVKIKEIGNPPAVREGWVGGQKIGQLCKDKNCTKQGISLNGDGLLFPEDLRKLADKLKLSKNLQSKNR